MVGQAGGAALGVLFALVLPALTRAQVNTQNCNDWNIGGLQGCPSNALFQASNNPQWILDVASDSSGILTSTATGSAINVAYRGGGRAPAYRNVLQDDGRPLRYFNFHLDYLPSYARLRSYDMLGHLTVGVWFRCAGKTVGKWSSEWAFLDFDRSEFFTAYVTPDGYLGFSYRTRTSAHHFDRGKIFDLKEPTGLPHLRDGKWHYATFVFDCTSESTVYSSYNYAFTACATSTVRMYRDGVLSLTHTSTLGYGVGAGQSYYFGRQRYGMIGDGSEASGFNGRRNGIYFTGDIAMLHFSQVNSATAAQVLNMYQATRPYYQSCPAGFFYEAGAAVACEAGYYCPGDFEKHECGVGNYCPPESTAATPIPAGYAPRDLDWTLTTNDLIQPCPAGWYCAGDGTMPACGGNDVYCVVGSTSPQTVGAGNYSVGNTPTTRTAEVPCEPGYYCALGARAQCPAGKYGSAVGLLSSGCSGNCTAGYFCPAGSTGKKQENCGIGAQPATLYCPEGTTARLDVPADSYSLPEDAPETNRYGAQACPAGYVCENGMRSSVFSWAGGTPCENGTDTATVEENVFGAYVATVRALYTAGPVQVNFSDAASLFLYNETTGNITLRNNVSLDFEESAGMEYRVTLAAETADFVSVCNLIVTVGNRNDAPQITSSGSFFILEQSDYNAPVGQEVAVSDPDIGQEVLLEISGGNEAGFFDIEACTGQIRLVGDQPLLYEDHQEFNLTITATDNGGPLVGGPMNASATIRVTVGNINDPPEFTISSPSVFVNENLPAGAVARPNAEWTALPFSDPDVHDTHIWFLVNSVDVPVVINRTTGVLTTTRTLDFEDEDSYTVTVAVQDSEGAIDRAEVRLFVNDTNDPPTATYTGASIAENVAIGTTVGYAPAVADQDGDSVTFAINAQSTSGNVFAVNSSTGVLRVAAILDYETTPSYTVSVDVSDGENTTTVTASVGIEDANDSPVAQAATFSIYENASFGFDLGDVQFSDADAGQIHTFALHALAGNGDDHTFFRFASILDSTLSVAGVLDYETHSSPYRFQFSVEDNGAGQLTDKAVVTVTVLDANDAPTLDQTSVVFEVPEKADGEAPFAGVSMNATDVDTGSWGTLTFSVDHPWLSIRTAGDKGFLSLARTLNYENETEARFEASVTVTDGGGLQASTDITVDVIDMNDAPYFATVPAAIYVVETAGVGSSIQIINGADDDAVGSSGWARLNYSISDSASPATFAIHNETGEVTLASEIRDGNGDLQVSPWVVITITDGGGLSVSRNLSSVVTGDNFAPSLSSAEFSVSEDTVSGTVGIMQASDQDAEQSLTFAIAGCAVIETSAPCGGAAAFFSIENVDDALNRRGRILVTDAALDYESDSFSSGVRGYELQISATDNPLVAPLQASAVARVLITDVPEKPRIYDRGTSVLEDTAVGSVLVTLSATDDDEQDTLSFSLVDSSHADVVAVNEATGVITLSSSLDFETAPLNSIPVQVTDSAGLSANATFELAVINVEEAPAIAAGQVLNVSEAAVFPASVGVIAAADPDSGDYEDLVYTITSDPSGLFSIVKDASFRGVLQLEGGSTSRGRPLTR